MVIYLRLHFNNRRSQKQNLGQLTLHPELHASVTLEKTFCTSGSQCFSLYNELLGSETHISGLSLIVLVVVELMKSHSLCSSKCCHGTCLVTASRKRGSEWARPVPSVPPGIFNLELGPPSSETRAWGSLVRTS